MRYGEVTPEVAETWATFCSDHWILLSIIFAASMYIFMMFVVFALGLLEAIKGK